MQPISETATPVGTELLSDAKTVGSSAVNRLHSEVDARKNDAVTQVHAVSSTIERAAESLDPNAPTWLKSLLAQGAEQIKSFADTLEHNDSRQMASQVTEFAKRSPGTFLGACAAVGFAAARVFKASSGANEPTRMGSVSPVQSMPPLSSDSTNNSAVNAVAPRGEFV
ncbi:hypothetical protein [Sphingorhabdus sp.]|uniref:hypothetical protein n=1 Tax=Sphingorhabdus sp. TaxID=1902408 RepID=UPI00398395B3